MSSLERALQNGEKNDEDSWSDIDESLLAQCDYIDASCEGKENVKSSESNCSSVVISDRDADVIKTVSCCEMEEIPPLHLFNKGDYLCVTDLTQQLWCEQHLSYTLMGVELPAPTSLDGDIQWPVPVADRPEVKTGKSVHLARELEIHDVVDIKITSPADKWALHTLNLLTSIRAFLAGVTVVREVPIFGDPFGKGDLFFGIIDELRFDPDAYAVRLLELKTRKAKRLPGKAQRRQHVLQVHMYKQLWDNLVTGNFNKQLFLSKLNLTALASQQLSKDLLRHIKSSAISALTLSDLLCHLLSSAQALVCISSLEIEYILQDTGSVISQFKVEEDGDWFWQTYCHCMDFWHGRRQTQGVDIEEAWKCGGCEYSPICEWRIRKSLALSQKNQQQGLGGRISLVESGNTL